MKEFVDLRSSTKAKIAATLPGNGDRYTGELSFAPGQRVSLNLTVPVGVDDALAMNASVVNGEFIDGRRCTLLDCSTGLTHGGGGSVADLVVTAEHLVMWPSVEGSDAPLFDRLRVAFTRLDDWMGESSIECPTGSMMHQDATFRLRSLARLHIDSAEDGMRLSTLQRFGWNWGDAHHVMLRSTFYVLLSSPTPLSIHAWTTELGALQGLLSLLCGHQVSPEELGLRAAGVNDHRADSIGWFTPHASASHSGGATTRLPLVLLPLPKVREHMPQIWRTWRAHRNAYETAVELFSSITRFPHQLPHFQFLAIMQALETLHRARFDGTYLSKEDYVLVRDRLIGAIGAVPAPLRASLKAKIGFGNEYSLRTRLKKLATQMPSVVVDAICPRMETMIDAVVQTRNYLTHYSSDLRDQALRGEDLAAATRVLRWLFTAIVLWDLGVPDETLAGALSQNFLDLHWSRDRLVAALQHSADRVRD